MMSAGLEERLVRVAEVAIRKCGAAIAEGARQLRSVHVELEIANGGAVVDTITHLEWKTTTRRSA